MNCKSLYSIEQLSVEEIRSIIDAAQHFEVSPNSRLLQGRIVASLFFEPSTRTRLSFETAVNRLGGRVIGFSDANSSSTSKGESLKDTIMMVANYADVIVMRHHLEGAALYAAEMTDKPIINAGDGANQHPTQTLLDLYSIQQTQGTLDNLHITVVGDLKYGRTVHSLIEGMSHFTPKFRFVAPAQLSLPREYIDLCQERGIAIEIADELTAETIADTDIVYMTRLQRERFTDEEDYEAIKNAFVLDLETLRSAKPNMRILHPLPRVNEIAVMVDNTPYAYYFKQAENGLYVREALLCRALNIHLESL